MAPETPLRDGRYIVRSVLGEGAQGVTVEATDTQSGRLVAIKRFDVAGARSWKDVELAERETRVLATLDHPLVPRYIEHFEEEGALYLVMEKVEGETLEAIRAREGALPEDEVRRFLASADRALSYLHGRAAAVIHRDVKPRNVVRRPDGSYVFVDFGAVSELLMRRGASTIVGTAGYMAPEQLQGRAMPSTDVYAVGATALAALTGAEPETLPHKGLKVDVRAALAGRASSELVLTLERMLEPDPDLRPATVGAALDAMNSVSTRPPRPRERAPRSAARTPLSSEDAAVKSLRALLWTLWGLSWVIVPLILTRLGIADLIPLVMFGSLAGLLIVTWHKGALLRPAIRAFTGRTREGETTEEDVERVRVEAPRLRVDPGGVRVETADLTRDEMTSDTQVSTDRRARKRHS
jgi:serine/threonine protein kinase